MLNEKNIIISKEKEKEKNESPKNSWEEIAKELEKIKSNIEIRIDEDWIDEEHKEVFNKILEFTQKTSDKFKEKFIELIAQYNKEIKIIHPKIINLIEKKNFNLPQFKILNGFDAESFLNECNFNIDIEFQQDSFLLVFQLPKPLAKYWYKGGETESDDQKIKQGKEFTTEWGYFYRKIMPVIWEQRGYYAEEEGLNFNRVNDISQHNPKKYYYIWEISNWYISDYREQHEKNYQQLIEEEYNEDDNEK